MIGSFSTAERIRFSRWTAWAWAAVAAAMTPASGDDWPRWNGSSHAMISHESGWATDWTAQPPQPLWRREVGVGFSSVSVVGDRLYTAGFQEKDVIHCLNAATGEPLWSFSYDCSMLANMHEGGPGATPTVADGRVYTFSREGHAYCLDAADGGEIWRQFLPEITGIKHPTWGLTASPLVSNGLVIYESGSLVALDAATGELRWKTQERLPGYGSAMTFEHDGKALVATLNNNGLLVVDPADGREVAFHEWKTMYDTNATTPIYDGGRFFLSTGYNRGCAMLRFTGSGFETLFENKELSNHMNNSVIFQGNIYGIHGNSSQSRRCQLVCLDGESGSVRWSKQGLGCGSLLIADGHIIALGDGGTLTCGAARPEDFEPTGRLEVLDGKCWTVPVLAGGRLYCRSAKGELVCLQLGNR